VRGVVCEAEVVSDNQNYLCFGEETHSSQPSILTASSRAHCINHVTCGSWLPDSPTVCQ